jgi:hypothetical protein
MRHGALRPAVRTVTVATVLSLALAGAACEDPYERDARERGERAPGASVLPPRATSTPAATITPGPTPDVLGAALPEPVPQPTPAAAVRAFAREWSNWSWEDFEAHRSRLAALATGAYLGELAAPADGPDETEDAVRLRPARRGTIESLHLEPGGGRQRRAVVVMAEQQLFDGKPQAPGDEWSVYAAGVRRVAGGWLISSWEPRS